MNKMLGLIASVGAYTPDYVFADIADITGDVVGTGLIEAKDFTSLFVLLGVLALGVGVVAWMRGR